MDNSVSSKRGTLEPVAVNSKDAAVLLGISDREFRKRASTGEMPPSFRIGRRRLWSVESIQQMVRDRIGGGA